MYIYIKSNISNNFVEFEYPFDETLYNNIGATWQDYLNGMWVLLSNEQVEFHRNYPDASVEEVWNMSISHERTLDQAKSEMIQKIQEYDNSTSVNDFLINGEIHGWFTPEERSNYKSSVDAAKLIGIQSLDFFINNIMFTVSTEQAEQILAIIQLYADKCYIVTKQHIIYVESLETIEEVDNFNYKQGYPPKPNFQWENSTKS